MVHIKRIVMHGFKSFARKTEIAFDKGINVILGPNGSGKSCSYDTLVTLSTGEEVELGKLIDNQIEKTKKNDVKKLDDGIYVDGDGSIKIISLNKDTMRAEEKEVSKFIRRKGDALYRIKTRTGKELKATGCHPVMAFVNGGVDSVLISDLKIGSLIATPRIIEIGGEEIDKDYARLIGYIIGDGYIAKDRIEFVNADKEIIEDFRYLTKEKLRLDIRERNEKNVVRTYIRDKKFVREIRDLFYKGYEDTITSAVKQIPQKLMRGNVSTISNLIAGLYDTDGSVRKDIAVIEYCTKNPKLAKQVQGLLLRFGISSKVKKRICNAVIGEKKVPGEYYYIYIYGKYNFEKFYNNISLRAKHKIGNIKMHLEKNVTANSNVDLLPSKINRYVRELANLLGIQVKPLRKEYPLLAAYNENRCLPTRDGIKRILPIFKNKIEILSTQFRNLSLNQLNIVEFMDGLNLSSHETSNQIGLYSTTIRNQWATNKFNARPENLQKFYNLVKIKYSERIVRIQKIINLLKNISDSDIYWDEIISIEKLDTPEYVYDLTIEDNHNFIANNIFAHNSNISDALCFALGRLSIKSMRAAKAKNLMFMGSKEIKPAKEAYVELVFDNSDKAFAIDSDEISLKRIVRHTGQSIYKINNEAKTRSEVIETLAQGGIDPYGFNIILQGQIQSVVRMHPEDRRKIIEEVAGIAIYESRKEKSLKELEKTDSRLKEISTILRERTAYLRNLENERSQALKFKELETTVKRSKASILHKKIGEKKKELESIQKSIEAKIKQKDNIRSEGGKIQSNLDSLSEKINQINKHIQKSSGVEQDALHDQISNLKAEMEGLRVRKENYENRESEIEKRIEEMTKSMPQLEAEINDLKKKSPLMEKKSNELKRKKDELALIEDERKKLFSVKTELNSLKERVKDKERQLGRITGESESLLKQLEENSERLSYRDEETCFQAINELRNSLIDNKNKIESLSKAELDSEKLISVLENEIKRIGKIKTDVGKIDLCPLCQSKITENHKEHVFVESEGKIKEANDKLEKTFAELEKIKTQKQVISIEIEKIEEKGSFASNELNKHKNIKDKKEQLKKVVNEEKTVKNEIKLLEDRRKGLEEKTLDIGKIEEKYDSKILEIEEISARNEENIDTTILYKERELENIKNIIKRSKKDLEDIESEIEELSSNFENKTNNLAEKEEQERTLNEKFKKMFEEREKMQNDIQADNLKFSEAQNEARAIEDQINYLKIGNAKLDAEREAIQMEMNDFVGIELLQGSMAVLEEKLAKSQESLMRIGSINMRALEVYDEIKKEYDAVQEKVTTLDNEKQQILKIIEEIDNKKSRTFMKTFRAMSDLFSQNFAKLYTKGTAFLDLENKENIFEGGVNIVVKLAKGKYFDVTSLSGGEQTLVALSLLFAIQEYKPYHFYIFDEIDAALDKRNSERLAGLLQQYMKAGQYIVITHNDAIITESDVLYGVSMHEGLSKILSLKV